MVSLAATLGEGYPKTGGWNDARSDFRAAISVAGAYDLNTADWDNRWTALNQDPKKARAFIAEVENQMNGARISVHGERTNGGRESVG